MNLGNFLNISEALAALPNGGNEGDTIVVSGLILAWNATSQEWVDPQTMSYGYNVRKIDGDLQVANRVTVGGVTTLNANVKIKRNLRVEGTLDAFNIKGAGKGLFPNSDELKRCYPAPESGWWAIVGDTLPGPIWIVVDGQWQSSGNIGGDTVDLTDYLSKGELEQGIGSSKINAMSQDAVTRIFVTKDSKQAIGLITVSNEVEINTVLDTYNHPRHVGLYNLCFENGNPWAILEITTDSMMHVVNQCIKGNMIVKDGVITGHQDNLITEIQRTYNFSAPNLDIPVRTWGKWQYCHARYLKSVFGESVTDTVTQKFFTEQTQGRVLCKIEIDNVFNINDVLDSYSNESDIGYYIIHDANNVTWGLLEITSNQGGGFIQQRIKSNISISDKGDITGQTLQDFSILERVYNHNSEQVVDPSPGTWSKWQYNHKRYLKSEFGASITDAITQKFFSDKVQNVVSGRIDIGNGMSVLDEYNSPEKCGWYVLMRMDKPAYHLLVTSDDMSHVITQFLYGNSVINEDGEIKAHQDYSTTILTRTYNIYAPMLPDIPARTWGKWRYEYESYMVDLPESEYVKLRDAGKVDKNIYYFTYEDEV